MPSPAIIVQPSPRTAIVLVLLYTVFVTVVAFSPDAVIRMLNGEDGFVEIASALAYVGGFIVCIALARRTTGWSRAHWLMWAVFCVMFFGEETSWLQSWVRYDTPASVKDINAQGEFNLHNLDMFSPDGRILREGTTHFSWRFLLDSQHMFNLGFGTYFLVFPLLMLLSPVRRLALRFGFPVLTGRFVLMTWIPIVVSAALTFLVQNEPVRKALIAETREMFFALTICAFIAIAYESTLGTPAGGAGRTR